MMANMTGLSGRRTTLRVLYVFRRLVGAVMPNGMPKHTRRLGESEASET
jgi:hypothetical protein